MGDLTSLGEFGIVALFEKLGEQPGRPTRPWVQTGIGDDCAVFDLGRGECLLATTDMLIERIHFLRDQITPFELGQKALAVNVSDVAAMGGEPTAALLALALDPALPPQWVEAFRDGLAREAALHEVDLVGGDTVSSGRDLAISVTLLGRALASEVVRRKGARAGDSVYLGRTVGDSAAGLAVLQTLEPARHAPFEALLSAHRTPRPQVKLGRMLGTHGLATAMIDVSDGVAQDLGHICRASGVGARIEALRLPLSEPARALAAALGRDPCDWALAGGEDYCLLFTVAAPRETEALNRARSELGIEIHRIGAIVAEPTVRVLRDGAWTEPAVGGFDHFGRPEAHP